MIGDSDCHKDFFCFQCFYLATASSGSAVNRRRGHGTLKPRSRNLPSADTVFKTDVLILIINWKRSFKEVSSKFSIGFNTIIHIEIVEQSLERGSLHLKYKNEIQAKLWMVQQKNYVLNIRIFRIFPILENRNYLSIYKLEYAS